MRRPAPLAGLRVIEFAGFGPGPFAAMVLSDLGADVLRIDRPGGADPRKLHSDVLARGRRGTIFMDVKKADSAQLARALAERADVLLDPFRPGVMERLGLGPAECQAQNPRLVYVRATGWGQRGPYADVPGHDINFLAATGALHCIGQAGGPPVPPLNLVADYGGGGMLALVGTLVALLERERSGVGEVVDAAMVDGIALLMAELHGLSAEGQWKWERGRNLLDGGAPFYSVYETQDRRWLAVGALEPKFYEHLLTILGLDVVEWPQHDQQRWPALRSILSDTFGARSLAEWKTVFSGSEACVTPVLTPEEAAEDPHLAARNVLVRVNGIVQPAPAPRFSRLAPRHPSAGQEGVAFLREWGVSAVAIDSLTRLDSSG